MSTIDIRNSMNQGSLDTIIFNDDEAYAVKKVRVFVEIHDTFDDFVQLLDKEHAQNLIKALEKAIELGWLE